MQACGVEDIAAAKSPARNLFVSCFLRCLKANTEHVNCTFETLEKRIEDDITVEPHTKTAVLAFHHLVKTSCWLGIDPEQTPFPFESSGTILEGAGKHEQLILDASDFKSTAKPG